MGEEKAPLKQSGAVIFVVPALCGLSVDYLSLKRCSGKTKYVHLFILVRKT